LAGTLKADLVNGYVPATTDSFTPITFASESGGFANFLLPSGSGYQFAGAVTFTNVVVSAAPSTAVTTTVSAGTVLHAVAANDLGINTTYWDSDAVTSQTAQAVSAAGLGLYRFPGGSASDEYHFNVADNLGDSAAITIPQFAQFISSVDGTGIVTLDYGSGSPQEAAAEMAYLLGSPLDTTAIGSGIQWLPGASAWTNTNWGTVGYWASLRGQSPLATDDGLNFLRIDHPAPFTKIQYWEIGNEEYGSWETDYHGTAGPGGVSTGAQHDPATYVAFAKTFAALAGEITAAAGLPGISIGIDSGDPTGASDNSWTKNVLADGAAIGFVPGFISDHNYVQSQGQENDSSLLGSTVTDPASVSDWATRYADYQTVLQQTLASQASGVQVLATEYNSVDTNPGKQSTSLVNGLFVADALGSLLDSGYGGACIWDLRNGWDSGSEYNNSNALYGWRTGGDYGVLGTDQSTAPSTGPYIAYPDYYALQLGSKIVLSGGEVVSADSNYADLDVYAVVESDGDLCLLVVNANPAAAITDQISVAGFQPAGPTQIWQYGKTEDTAQSQSATGASALTSTSTNLALDGAAFSYSFPAYSMTVLDLQQAAAVVNLVAAPSPSIYGQPVTFTATVTAAGAPVTSGTVAFEEGTTVLAAAVPLNANGQASFSISTLAASATPHVITALYGGTSEYAAGYGTTSQSVLPGMITVGLFDSQTSTFYLHNSDGPGLPDIVVPFQPTSDVCDAVAGDWTGNGTTRVGLYDPATGTFYLANSNVADPTYTTVIFRPTSDACIPVVGDWTDSGVTTIGVYDPATSTFYERDSNTAGTANASFVFGPAGSGWLPVAGDWTGGGTTTVGLYNPAAAVFYLRTANAAGAPDAAFQFGSADSSSVPLAGPWYASGATTVGLYNLQTSVFSLRNSNTAGPPDTAFQYGPAAAHWTPIVGNWSGSGPVVVVGASPVAAAATAPAVAQTALQPTAAATGDRSSDSGRGTTDVAAGVMPEPAWSWLPSSAAPAPGDGQSLTAAAPVMVPAIAHGNGWLVVRASADGVDFATGGDEQADDQDQTLVAGTGDDLLAADVVFAEV
jgi:hypothetical protein